jgi:uncharacterized membrane protein
MNRALWALQILLGLFFVLASGAPKLFIPPEALPMPIPIPHALLLFIGICEVLGGLALIVPGLIHRWVGLTPLAAAALVLLTICAAGYQLMANAPGNAVFALVFGALCAFIAYGRWKKAPLREGAAKL